MAKKNEPAADAPATVRLTINGVDVTGAPLAETEPRAAAAVPGSGKNEVRWLVRDRVLTTAEYEAEFATLQQPQRPKQN